MKNNAQQSMNSSAPLSMNKSATLSMSKFVTQSMRKFVKLPSQAMEDQQLELVVGMVQLLLLLAAKYQDNSARMSPDRCPGKSAKLFQDNSARMSPDRCPG